MKKIRLGVNIDHVATIRNARGGKHPDPADAALMSEKSGADGITAHLREDRRHISDRDITNIKNAISIPFNLEIAATSEMLEIALRNKPNAVCIVPEKREEITTEGGLNIKTQKDKISLYIKELKKHKIKSSLFLEANEEDIHLAKEVSADIIEFHTGKYCNIEKEQRQQELIRIKNAVLLASSLNIECHAGHGLDYESAGKIAAIEEISELNIGHFLIGEAIFFGLENVIKKMKNKIKK